MNTPVAPVRARARIAPSAPKSNNSSPSVRARGDGSTDWMATGSTAEQRDAQEKQRRIVEAEQRAKNWLAPYRFRLKKGEQAEIIILDNELGPRINEHERWNQRLSKREFETCPGDWEVCPLCEAERAGFGKRNYVMLLSVIDLTPRIIQKGDRAGEEVPYKKKLMAVKFDQIDKYKRMAERNGGLRGCQVLMVRGNAQTSYVNGEPEFIEKHSEDAIIESFAHAEVRNDKGEVVRPANDDCYAYDYGVIFPKPSGEALTKLYGGSPVAGSKADNHNPENEGWGEHNPGQAPVGNSGSAQISSAPKRELEKPKGIRPRQPVAPVVTASEDEEEIDEIPM